MGVSRRPSPEERYLQKKRAELAELEAQLAERELELHTLRGGMIAFEAQYEAVVSAKYALLDELRVQIAELTPVTEPQEQQHSTSGSSANEGPKVPANPQAGGGAVRSRRKPPVKPRPTPPAPAATALAPPPKPPDFNPAESLKKLYRDVAKAMHPDLADTDPNRAHRHLYMIRANQAYEAGDEAKLVEVFEEWQHSPETVQGEGAAAELVRVIRKIDQSERRLVAIAAELAEIENSGMYGMKTMAEEAAKFQRDLLAEMTERLDVDIADAKQLLAQLQAAHPLPPAADASPDTLPPPAGAA